MTHPNPLDFKNRGTILVVDDIPISGRLMAVADVYDALISQSSPVGSRPRGEYSGVPLICVKRSADRTR